MGNTARLPYKDEDMEDVKNIANMADKVTIDAKPLHSKKDNTCPHCGQVLIDSFLCDCNTAKRWRSLDVIKMTDMLERVYSPMIDGLRACPPNMADLIKQGKESLCHGEVDKVVIERLGIKITMKIVDNMIVCDTRYVTKLKMTT
ncbi:MAG: hypothetical protein LBK70_00415 [Clostridiales bacterium]|jgi:hypothetical protein|nr:hypothetical protein [Clostridiales bacterium]